MWQRFFFVLIVALAAPFLLIGVYVGFSYWDDSRIRHLCAAIPTGTPVEKMRAIITDYRFGESLAKDNVSFDEIKRTSRVLIPGPWQSYVIPIPTSSRMGEMGCTIEHDGSKVVSSHLFEP